MCADVGRYRQTIYLDSIYLGSSSEKESSFYINHASLYGEQHKQLVQSISFVEVRPQYDLHELPQAI